MHGSGLERIGAPHADKRVFFRDIGKIGEIRRRAHHLLPYQAPVVDVVFRKSRVQKAVEVFLDARDVHPVVKGVYPVDDHRAQGIVAAKRRPFGRNGAGQVKG